ncbi:hypothetical protein [Thiocapsa roseopersicina]|uniref:Uncharacterized protein n=1 Tax=Thiocapsa roseopersicina TaxID=1058 RepID=A0A1H3CNJ8_THIRO|nr:hypothetical protein [Thiocapsa roseopersicina]SDX55686.1 hypothetical protein SAMN05421783_13610 [Thiocapsa roseopersicina]
MTTSNQDRAPRRGVARPVELGEGCTATVRELCVRDVRRIVALTTPEQLTRPIRELVRENLPELLDLLGEALELPDGTSVDDLSLSDCEAIGTAWWEMHERFFSPLASLARHALAAGLVPPTPASSTAPVSRIPSSADTATSETTTGPST